MEWTQAKPQCSLNASTGPRGPVFLFLFGCVGNPPRIREGQPSTPMISRKPWRSAGLLARLPARG